MKSRHLLAGALALAMLVGFSAAVNGQEQGPAARKALMKSNGQAFGAIKAIVGGEGAVADAAAHATTINDNAKRIPVVFDGGVGAGETRAKPEIWTDWDGFLAIAARLEEESAKLIEAANSGNRETLAEQFGALGANACGACHGTYRGPRN